MDLELDTSIACIEYPESARYGMVVDRLSEGHYDDVLAGAPAPEAPAWRRKLRLPGHPSTWAMAQLVSALRLQRRGRPFESD